MSFSDNPLFPGASAREDCAKTKQGQGDQSQEEAPFKTDAPRITRRRALTISGAIAGAQLMPWPANSFSRPTERAQTYIHRWRGRAFGTQASFLLHGVTKADAGLIFQRCRKEISRLEQVFSLYDSGSAVSRLNHESKLDSPPIELVNLLEKCNRISEASKGAFDITVQPLWNLYKRHFTNQSNVLVAPGISDRELALRKVDYTSIDITPEKIAFAQPDMMITLNGIAQGYITDRIVEIMREHGIQNVLVDLGETRSLGEHTDRRPWNIGIIDPRKPEIIGSQIALRNEAVASSGGYGTIFEPTGRNHHLFDPFSGKSAQYNLGVTVVAQNATTADALSTAISVMPLDQAVSFIKFSKTARALVTTLDGALVNLKSS